MTFSMVRRRCGSLERLALLSSLKPFFCLSPDVAFSARNFRCLSLDNISSLDTLGTFQKSLSHSCSSVFVCLCIYSVYCALTQVSRSDVISRFSLHRPWDFNSRLQTWWQVLFPLSHVTGPHSFIVLKQQVCGYGVQRRHRFCGNNKSIPEFCKPSHRFQIIFVS